MKNFSPLHCKIKKKTYVYIYIKHVGVCIYKYENVVTLSCFMFQYLIK